MGAAEHLREGVCSIKHGHRRGKSNVVRVEKEKVQGKKRNTLHGRHYSHLASTNLFHIVKL